MNIRRSYILLFFLFSVLCLPMPSTLKAQYPSRFEDYYIVGNPDSIENAIYKLQSNKEQYLHGLIGLELNRHVFSNKFGQDIETINKLATECHSEFAQAMYNYFKGISLINSDKTTAVKCLLETKELFELNKDTVGQVMCWVRLLQTNYDLRLNSFGDSVTQKKCYENIVKLGEASTSPYAKLLVYRAILMYKERLYKIFDLDSNEKVYKNAIKIIDKYPRFEYLRIPFAVLIGLSYSHAKEYAKALELNLDVYNKSKNLSIDNRVTCASNVGHTYLGLKDFNNAKKYFQIGVTLWKEHSATDKEALRDCYKKLAEIEFEQKHYNKAWDYRSMCDSLDVAMHKATISSSLIEAQTKYETLKKETENNKLQVQVENNNRRIKYLVVSLIGGSILSLLIVFLYKRTQNKNAELKRLNELTETQNEKLSNANRKLENFSHALSHDAFRYINNILNFSEIGKEAIDKEATQMALQKIQQNAFRLNKMTQNLIQYNIIKRTFTPQTFLVNDILCEIAEDVEPELNLKNASLIIQPNMPLVFADRELTKEVCHNLIGNALKFGKPDTPLSINVSFSLQNDLVEIQIKDNGIGIPEDKQDIIFKEFVKADKKSQGSGLGLYISKEIIETMGGTMRLESKEGEGSTFFFTLPLG